MGIITVIDKGPVSIRYLRWKNTTCNFGRLGGLDVHFPSEEEADQIVSLLLSKGGKARWRRSYMGTPAVYLAETVQDAS